MTVGKGVPINPDDLRSGPRVSGGKRELFHTYTHSLKHTHTHTHLNPYSHSKCKNI